MKYVLFFLLTTAGLIASAQSFPYKAELKAPLSQDEKKALITTAEKSFLFSGNLSFNISESDLSTNGYKPDSTWFTVDQAIAMVQKEFVNASSNDSIDLYFKLSQYYFSKLDEENTRDNQVKAYGILKHLLNQDSVTAITLQQAGYFAYWINQDMNQAFPFYANAYQQDSTDSVSLRMMINMLYLNHIFDKADSLIKIAEAKTPNSAAPALFRMQMESIKMFDGYMENPEKIISSCLVDVANIDFIRKMRTNAASDDQEILSYLLEEYMLVMKYSKNLSGDTVITIPACDMETIGSMRKAFEKSYKKNNPVPRFTLSNALCWSYAIEQKYDKSVHYISRAIDDLENMGGVYLKTRATFYNTMLAMQYLNKDTAGAIATTIRLIAAHDSTGINPTDYFMLGTLYNRTAQYDKSIIVCEKGLRAGIDVSTGHRIMALNYYNTGRKEQAYEQLNKSIEADKSSFDNYMVYGLILLADDKPAEAARYLEAAWYINSSDSDLMKTLRNYFKRK